MDELACHNFVIKPDFNDGLKQIKDALDEVRDKLDEQHRLSGKELKLDIEKKLHLENHSAYGYCFRVTRTDASLVKNKRGYSDIATVKGGLYFTNESLRDLSNEFRDLSERYNREQSGLVKEVIRIAASYCPPLEQLNVVLANLDVIVSFAHVSENAPVPYTKPKVEEKGKAADINIKEVRHPCLEVQEDINFIPNDTEMVKDESELLVITGPNMGGKSTYIRQVGIVALMAQVGCFVPAAEGARLPVFDCILARVGAGDSQLKGVSTFMAEMLETATILKTATADSLIIIDELGRGTSTYDGFGLAWAISEWIATQIRCKCLFATHFHELTNLANQQKHVKNLHVVAHVSQREGGSRHDRDITLLYKVEPGISDQSLGINVAELANFPPSVIQLAKRKAEELEDDDGESTRERRIEKVVKANLSHSPRSTDDQTAALSMPEDVTAEGTVLIEEFMKTWVERSEKLGRDEADGEGGTKRRKVDPETELEELRRCVEEFRPRIEGNVSTEPSTVCLRDRRVNDRLTESHTHSQAWASKVLQSF